MASEKLTATVTLSIERGPLCPRCGKPAAEHPYQFVNMGAAKVWLSGPWAPWHWRLWDWITGTPCDAHEEASAQALASGMVAEPMEAEDAS